MTASTFDRPAYDGLVGDFLPADFGRIPGSCCGMIVNVDPTFHEERYGHTARLRAGNDRGSIEYVHDARDGRFHRTFDGPAQALRAHGFSPVTRDTDDDGTVRVFWQRARTTARLTVVPTSGPERDWTVVVKTSRHSDTYTTLPALADRLAGRHS